MSNFQSPDRQCKEEHPIECKIILNRLFTTEMKSQIIFENNLEMLMDNEPTNIENIIFLKC